MDILITSTSFDDSVGKHHDYLESYNFNLTKLRGPLKATELIPIIDQFDGIICGDDEYSKDVLKKGAKGKLKILSKYGVGLDKIDLNFAKTVNICVKNCLNINNITVSEHVFGLILTYLKNIHLEFNYTRYGNWTRLIGTDVYQKTIGILGLGNIGKEVAKRAKAFGMKIIAFDSNPDMAFCTKNEIKVSIDLKSFFTELDILSINLPLIQSTYHIINEEIISNYFKKGLIIVNTARSEIINMKDLIIGLKSGIVGAYLTDVLESEPMAPNHPLTKLPNVIITPHIASRTKENIEKQGIQAVTNLVTYLFNKEIEDF